jgi:hypothetical protein
MQDFLTANTTVITAIVPFVGGIFAGILTALVAPFVKHRLDKRVHEYKLEMDYEYEQRKSLRDLIGRSHGHLLQAVEILDGRIGSLYRHISQEHEDWLKVGKNYDQPDKYYFRTIVYKFLTVYAVIREFEVKNLFIDSRIAQKSDLDFLTYIRALQWVVSGTDLFNDGFFEGFKYNPGKYPLDHIYSDRLREMADYCLEHEGVLTPSGFQSWLKTDQSGDHKLDQVLRFFEGLEPDENNRLRWDRIVALHLLLKGFLDRFGYDYQKLTDQALDEVATEIKHPKVFENLIDKLAEFKLDKGSEVKYIERVISQKLSRTPQ